MRFLLKIQILISGSIFFQGDLVLQCDHLFELVSKLSLITNKQNVCSVVQGR